MTVSNKLKEYYRAYYQKHKERLKEYARQYYQKHKEEIKRKTMLFIIVTNTEMRCITVIK